MQVSHKDQNTNILVSSLLDVINKSLTPKLSDWWVKVILIAALLSLIEIRSDGWKLAFSVTTLILLSLIWLPFLLKILSLVGGGIKTEVGEVNTPGLIDLVARLLGVINDIGDQVDDKNINKAREIINEARREAEREIAAQIPDKAAARKRCEELAKRYQEIRKEPPGQQRTYKMSQTIAEIRALASVADYSSQELDRLFKSNSTGNRILVLAILQACPDIALFDSITASIQDSRSAFEQSMALRISENLVEKLNDEQKKRLREVIENEEVKKHIGSDDSRKIPAERILKSLIAG